MKERFVREVREDTIEENYPVWVYFLLTGIMFAGLFGGLWFVFGLGL